VIHKQQTTFSRLDFVDINAGIALLYHIQVIKL